MKTQTQILLGSLFDGIGGFPYAASQLGILPVWASEIEKAPIQITRYRFPDMKHLGDITQLDGGEMKPVDIITFGSPCTRLSQAGKHDGFDIRFSCKGKDGQEQGVHYERTIKGTDKYRYLYIDTCPICGAELTATNESALFFHAVRIVTEMRRATNGKYPTFIVWENVVGAFSSNRGEDFHAVLSEIAAAAENGVSVPRPPGGVWDTAGAIVADGWSLAWRVVNARFWGVPQNRRRIYLVADFGGQCAGKISFERPGLLGNFTAGAAARQKAARNTGNGVKAAGFDLNILSSLGDRSTVNTEASQPTLCSAGRSHVIAFMAGQGARAGGLGCSETATPSLRAGDSGLNRVPCVVAVDCRNFRIKEVCGTLQTSDAVNFNNPIVAWSKINGPDNGVFLPRNPSGQDGNDISHKEAHQYGVLYSLVRKLTPRECERLQGLPDDWTRWGIALDKQGNETLVEIADSPRYKGIGNGLMVLNALYFLEGIQQVILERRAIFHDPD